MCVDQNGDTPLILAIINENSEQALNIIKNGNCYPHIVNSYGDTALLLSIHKNMPHVSLEILNTGNANPGHVDNYGNTSLTLSIKKMFESVANKIIEYYTDFNINHVDAHFDNALNASLKLGLWSVAQKLVLNNKCDFTIVDDNGDTPLLISINKLGIFNYPLEEDSDGTIDEKLLHEVEHKRIIFEKEKLIYEYIIKNILKSGRSNPGHVNKNQTTALLLSMCKDAPIIGELILKTGNSNPSVINKVGDTSLLLALSKNYENICKLIVDETSINNHIISNNGDTPLLLALSKNYKYISEKIFSTIGNNKKNLESLSVINSCGDIALFFAINIGNEDLALKIFHSGYSKFDIISNEGDTSFIMAINNGMLTLAYEILNVASPSLISHVNKYGNTALILCLGKMFFDFAMKIVNSGHSNPDHINNENDTALLLAVNHGQIDIAKKLLLQMKINKYHKNNFNNDALIIAKIRNYTELFEYF
jgi:ankyrin repeat protein